MKLSVTLASAKSTCIDRQKVYKTIYIYDGKERTYAIKKGKDGSLVIQCLGAIKMSLIAANTIEIESEEVPMKMQ